MGLQFTSPSRFLFIETPINIGFVGNRTVAACPGIVMLRALAHAKQSWSKFHLIVFRLVGLKVHCDVLPNLVMGREFEAAAAEGEYPAALRVEPICCHHPPTAHRARFYLNLGDGGVGSPAEVPWYLTLEGDEYARGSILQMGAPWN